MKNRLASLVVLVVAVMALMGPALAGGSSEEPPTIKPGVRHRPRPAAERQATLPFTGADVTAFAISGLATIGGGALLVRRTRARKSA